jgi:hypothetical protein
VKDDVNVPSKSNMQKTFRIGFKEEPDPTIYFTTAPDPDPSSTLDPDPLDIKI